MIHIAAHAFLITRAKTLRNRNGKTGAGADAEAEDQKLHAGRGTDRCKCIRTEHLPDDHSVDHVISLLKNISKKKRKHEAYNKSGRISLCHTLYSSCRGFSDAASGFALLRFPVFI